ncbi:hypothetical protein QOZ80_4BG0347880 [Eleusine coracana subsp. coracana]|nr:hypothetical protein QOZ80_4BG0347880 [Eleusine coracana subsp. coracana]
MEAASKRVRGSGGSSGDRLSALTDDLLGRILSFLPSRQSVQTSVLSKRWTDLWRSVPAINLDVQDFRVRDDDHYQRWLKMEDFTTNLLMRHRVARLDAFRLHIIGFYEVESRDFHRWIRRAIEYRPSVLEITFVLSARSFRN